MFQNLWRSTYNVSDFVCVALQEAPHTYDFIILISLTHFFGCAANKKIGKAKDLSAPLCALWKKYVACSCSPKFIYSVDICLSTSCHILC
jgi:hypothetical protein